MAYIPDDFVDRAFENPVHSESEFYNAQIACKVTAISRDNVYNKISDFLRKLFQLFIRKGFEVLGLMYVV
jgi:hypothetical protein